MKQETTIANAIRAEFPNQRVTVKSQFAEFIHQTDTEFDTRSIPVFMVSLKATKRIGTTHNNRPILAEVEPTQLVEFLRNRGYFARLVSGADAQIANVPESQLPLNKSFKLEWKSQVTCQKVEHTGEGYLHAAHDDSPYEVDGVIYCGRCHRFNCGKGE